MAMTSPVNDGTAGATAARDRKITREIVLATALELIDRDGADALSMRRLAHALDRDPMILYRHAASKAALIDGIAETVLAQLHVDPADPDWNAQLRTVARGYRALALAHPHVVPLLVTRPLATPLGLRPRGTLRPLEDILALLTRAGFSGPDALHIYRALFVFLHGHILNELQELVENPDETDDLLRLGLHRLPIKEFPLLRSLGPALARYDGTAELERGLSILLAGLTTTLTPHTTPPPIPAQTTGHPQEDPPLSSPDTPHKVEIKDGDQTAAAAEVTTSQETGGTAQAAPHAASGHIAPGSRATLVDAVMNGCPVPR
jgi:AcrR family transcriptional regulator